MAKPEANETPNQAGTVKPKKSKLSLIVIGLLILTAGAAGFFGWQYFKGLKASASSQVGATHGDGEYAPGANPQAKSAKPSHKDASEGATINFEPFLVNLADRDASRYLRTTIRVVVDSKEAAEKVTSGEVLMSKIRDAILNILSAKISGEIVTTDGKEKLKKEILERLNSFLPEAPAQDVFFTDFVVQL